MVSRKLLFISHAEKDSEMVGKFVDLLYDMGVPEASMFCSSISEIGVPIKEDIYEYLCNLLDSEQVIPIFMLSKNYYSSTACLNEMGAVWVKQKNYFTFLLPGFEFAHIKGAINPAKRGIYLGYKSEREQQNLKEDLNQFRREISNLLSLEDRRSWERKRDSFISQIQALGRNCGVVTIGLKKCEGFCIGEYNHSACAVTFDETRGKISAKIDFAETKAEICSVVISTGQLNLTSQCESGKKLVFDLKASDTVRRVDVECRVSGRDVRKTIATTSEWENYCISLSEFGASTNEWADVKEIKFLLRRSNTLGGQIEVKGMMVQ